MIPSFEDGSVGLYREANSLAVVALALGTSPDDSPLKAAAPALIQAAQKAATAQNIDEAKAALDAVVAARAGKGAASAALPLEWKKVAALRPLMKNAVPAISTEIKRLARNEKTFGRAANTKKVLDNAATLVAISLGCRDSVDETLAPNESELWADYCDRLYAASLDFNDKIDAAAKGTGDFDAAKAAFKEVEATCNSTCHEKFGGQAAE